MSRISFMKWPFVLSTMSARRAALAGLGNGVAPHRRRRRGLPWHTIHPTLLEGNTPSLQMCLLLSSVQGRPGAPLPNAGAQSGPGRAITRSLFADLRSPQDVTDQLKIASFVTLRGQSPPGQLPSHVVSVVSQQMRRFLLRWAFPGKLDHLNEVIRRQTTISAG
jgi:hypothetical protein